MGERKRENLISGGLVACIQYMLGGEVLRGPRTLHHYTITIKVCKVHPENQFNHPTVVFPCEVKQKPPGVQTRHFYLKGPQN